MADHFRCGERAEIAGDFERLALGKTEQNAGCIIFPAPVVSTTCATGAAGIRMVSPLDRITEPFSERVMQATGDFTAFSAASSSSFHRAI